MTFFATATSGLPAHDINAIISQIGLNGTISAISTTTLQISYNNGGLVQQLTFTGTNFTFNLVGFTGGTVNSFAVSENGVDLLAVTGFSRPATQIQTLLTDMQAGSTTAFSTFIGTEAGEYTGSALSDVFSFGDGGDLLNGNDGADTLFGLGGADTINGGAGNDILYDGAGIDIVRGGADDDLIRTDFDSIETGDDFDGGTGTDGVEILGTLFNAGFVADLTLGTASFNGVTIFTMTNMEDFRHLDNDVGSDENIIGNGLDNDLEASGGTNTLSGLGGNDTLRGKGGTDTLDGGSGSDRLDGGADADMMMGGSGNDTYVVDNAGDTTIETSINDGDDTVETSISYDMAQFIERLVMTGADNIDSNGNDLANFMTGNDGINYINGGAGTDLMTGGGGNDTYTVDNLNDVIVELAGGGDDAVYSENDVQLSGNIETAILSSTFATAISAFGDASNNQLFGNEFNNVLYGRGGLDRMGGGAGDDIFVMAMGDQAANIQEQITDFEGAGVVGGDRMGLGGFGPGATLVQVSTNSYEVRDAGNVAQASFILEGVTTALIADDYYFN